MEGDTRTLRQLVEGSMYVVDPRAVANAIVVRTRLRATIACPSLRNERQEIEARYGLMPSTKA